MLQAIVRLSLGGERRVPTPPLFVSEFHCEQLAQNWSTDKSGLCHAAVLDGDGGSEVRDTVRVIDRAIHRAQLTIDRERIRTPDFLTKDGVSQNGPEEDCPQLMLVSLVGESDRASRPAQEIRGRPCSPIQVCPASLTVPMATRAADEKPEERGALCPLEPPSFDPRVYE
jgi:hypothetical protein